MHDKSDDQIFVAISITLIVTLFCIFVVEDEYEMNYFGIAVLVTRHWNFESGFICHFMDFGKLAKYI